MAHIHVRIPTPLRKFTQHQDVVSAVGEDVGQALANLMQVYPELQARIFDASGQVRRFVNVFANDEDIRFLAQLETTLEDGDELSIVPAIAGGSL